MADDDQPTDIRPGHFAKRETDRGLKGELVRLFEALDDDKKQELLRYAESLGRRTDPQA